MAEIPQPYASGEFDPQIGHRAAHTAAVFNGEVWLVGPNSDGVICYTRLQASDLLDNFKTSDSWRSGEISIAGHTPVAFGRCGLAVPTGASPGLYLVFAPPLVALTASRYRVDSNSAVPAWQKPMPLLDSSSNPVVVVPGAGAGAAAFDRYVLVACASAKLNSAGEPCLYVGVFDSEAAVDGQSWTAVADWSITHSDLQQRVAPGFGTLSGFGDTVDLAWFPQAGSDGNSPAFYLMVACAVSVDGVGGNSSVVALLRMQLDPAQGFPTLSLFSTQLSRLGGDGYSNFSLASDPPGRVIAFGTYTKNQTKVVQGWVFGTDGLPLQTRNLDSWPVPDWNNPVVLNAPSVNGVVPAVVFVLDSATSYTASDAKGVSYTCYPIYQVTFYGSPVRSQLTTYGYAATASQTVQPQPSSGRTMNIVTGIIDGPIPLPDQNIVGYKPFESTTQDAGPIVFGAQTQQQVQHQVTSTVTAGMQTEGSVSQGFGPAWNIAFAMGPTQAHGDMTATALSSSRVQNANLATKDDGSGTLVGTGVVPLGNLFTATASIHQTVYNFYGPQGPAGVAISDATSGTAGSAPKYVSLQVNLTDAQDLNYVPFLVTPGNLDSYMPDGIDATMGRLGYTGKSYFQEVILANAYAFAPNVYRLNFAWSRNGDSQHGFQQTTSSFTQDGWTLSNSDYVGVSGGGGFSLFGMGEEASFKVMLGVSVSRTATTTTTDQQEWGIAVLAGNVAGQDSAGPPSWDEPSAMASYSFSLYFLPVPEAEPTKWVDELIQYLPKVQPPPGYGQIDVATIDPSSQAWRIVCVVTSYLTNADQQAGKSVTRQYVGPLDPPPGSRTFASGH